MDADSIIETLGLEPHPEGGHYFETFRDVNMGRRDHSTAIYYLLRAGERSHWHRVDAVEVWHFYAGDPLALSIAGVASSPVEYILGTDLLSGQRPQVMVPKSSWQSARPLGDFTLVGCTVAPGFEFDSFEIAPPGWEPPR